jgi:diaminohydroxyphosphoribosylaminopyrimidine deaminase/5-amino-6-(5-phosphoribosylamino)uracil reductase
MVGAVLADAQGNVISFGYHEKFGEAHAEVNCLKNVDGCAKTLYVNLEPCAHQGKTPPCTDLIIKHKVKKVVVGMLDPNPSVSGSGVKKLREAGIEVVVGTLGRECEDLNKVFTKNITTQKPFIAIKTATTSDGKIATATGSSKWITSKPAREEVHRLRARYNAVMTGSGTVMSDDPSLTVRECGGNSPVRIVFDPNNKIPPTAKVFAPDGVKVIAVREFSTFDTLFKKLYQKGIYSVLVEAGSGLNSALIAAGEADWLYQFIAPKILGGGKSFVEGFDICDIQNCVKLEIREVLEFSPDILLSAKILYNDKDSRSP